MVLCCCAGKRERIDFAQTVTKYDRRFKVSGINQITVHSDTDTD